MKNNNLGKKLKDFRIAKGFTQQQLELEIGASFGHISRIESGDINPTKETLLRISNVLNLDLSDKLQLFPVVSENHYPKIGLLYTGGNISFDPQVISDNNEAVLEINKLMLQIPEVQIIASLEPIPPHTIIPSSMMSVEKWESMAQKINDNYDKYDGFIVTHGQDGMAYTASAISFMLQNINKPIIFTGALLPLKDNDKLFTSFSKYSSVKISKNLARRNVINAVYAACSDIAEVAILCGNQLVRANRTILKGYYENDIYESLPIPPLGIAEFGLDIAPHCERKKDCKRKYYPRLEKKVSYLKLHPNIETVLIDTLIEKEYKGIVLEVMGIGSFPPDIIPSIKEAVSRGITVVAVANPQAKWVDLNIFYTGWIGRDVGVIATKDMTAEAAYTKLMWILAQTDNPQKIRTMMLKNYVGEITE